MPDLPEICRCTESNHAGVKQHYNENRTRTGTRRQKPYRERGQQQRPRHHVPRVPLLRLVEDWRNALDNRQYAAAITMDLSKAFDCLPHGLLLGKLRAYGLSVKACALVTSYLSDRKQSVKLGPHCSEWSNITRVHFGPSSVHFFFINDVFQALGRSSLYNYADDNTLSYAHHNAETVIHTLQQDCSSLLHWFQENQMKVNPDKFQAISFGKRGNGVITDFKCDTTQVKCEDPVVLLGIELDHIS